MYGRRKAIKEHSWQTDDYGDVLTSRDGVQVLRNHSPDKSRTWSKAVLFDPKHAVWSNIGDTFVSVSIERDHNSIVCAFFEPDNRGALVELIEVAQAALKQLDKIEPDFTDIERTYMEKYLEWEASQGAK